MKYIELIIILTILTKLLIDLIKFYINNTKKYKREVHNIFNAKLQVFHDCCITVKVLKE